MEYGNLIDRQALCEYALNQKDKCVTPNDIMRFPSAEPDVPDTNVGDTISRQAVIETVLAYLVEYCGAAFDEDMQRGLKKRLDAMPSAHPERKKSKWVVFDTLFGDEAHCWECHRSLYVNDPGNGLPDVKELHFCPFCGADMREGKEDG